MTNPTITSDDAKDFIVKTHQDLTTPQSEDWTVVVNKDVVHLVRTWERDGEVTANISSLSLEEFHSFAGCVSDKDDIGCVTIILPKDAEECGAYDLLAWLSCRAKISNFSLVSVSSAQTAVKCVSNLSDFLTDYTTPSWR